VAGGGRTGFRIQESGGVAQVPPSGPAALQRQDSEEQVPGVRGETRIQGSGFRSQGRSAGPALWTCGSSKAGVGSQESE